MTRLTCARFTTIRSLILAVATVYFAVPAAAGCTSEVDPGPAGMPPAGGCGDLTGTWAGTWVSHTSSGTWEVDFTQTGSGNLDGDIRLTGTVCGTGGAVTGRLDPDTCELSFGLVDTARCDVSYSGSVSGDDMDGTMEATAVAYGGLHDEGTWEGSRR